MLDPLKHQANWAASGNTLDVDFTKARAAMGRIPRSVYDLFSVTRASTGYAQTVGGVLVPFANNVLRITDKGILVEATATNLLLRSQFDAFGSDWANSNGTGTANVTTAPDLKTTAAQFIEDTSAAGKAPEQLVTKAASAIQYTASVYIKRTASNNRSLYFYCFNGPYSGSASAFFRLTDGTIPFGTGVSGSFTSCTAAITALANGWFRCAMTFTSDTDTGLRFRPILSDDSANANYTGDGSSGLYYWGAQLETGAFASSLVTTTTATATRSNENVAVTKLGSPAFISQNAISAVVSGPANPNLGVVDGEVLLSGNNNGALLYLNYFSSAWHFNEQWNGNFENSQATSDFNTNAWCGGLAVDGAGVAIYGKGAAGVNTDAVAKLNNDTSFAIGGYTTGGSYLNGYISRFTLWPFKMTNNQLRATCDAR